MKEFIALLAVANACFILGSFFGACVYHAIQRLAQKGKAEVRYYVAEAKDAVLKVAEDVKDGLPHA